MRRQRPAAIVALIVGTATVGFAIANAVNVFPRGLIVLACVLIAGACAWYGVLRRGAARIAGLAVAALVLVGVVILVVADGARFADLLIIAGLLVSPGRVARRVRRSTWICRAPPRRATRCCSSTRSPAAGRRSASSSPTRHARAASSRSSSAPRGTSSSSCATRSPAAPMRWRWPVAMARRRSSRRSPPSANCPTPASRPARATTSRSTSASTATTSSVPSTRSSTAASVRSILPRSTDACSSTTSRSGSTPRPSSGEEYRDAKIRTLLDTVPDMLGPGGSELDLRWTGPGGSTHHAGAMVLVSNNRYRLGRAVGSGTRPRIDDGLLGVTVVGEPDGWRGTWAATAAPVARMVGADVRGRRGPADRRRHRRRGAAPRSAVEAS